MEICKTVGIIFLILYSLLYLRLLIKTEKPIKQFFCNSVVSFWFWAVLNLTAFFTKLYIPLNIYTLISVTFGGIPFGLFLAVFRNFVF
jgi:hypothetical protein